MTTNFTGPTIFSPADTLSSAQSYLPQQGFEIRADPGSVLSPTQKISQSFPVILPHKNFSLMSALNEGVSRYFKQQGLASV